MNWYNSLTTPEKIYFYIAVIGTVLLVIQIIMMICSFGGGADADADGDFGGDGAFDSADGDLGISLFTIKGLTAFFAIGGWVGLLILQINSENIALAIVLSLVSGLGSMILVALALKGIAKLQCNGNLDKEKLIGKEAGVYVSIAPSLSLIHISGLLLCGQYARIQKGEHQNGQNAGPVPESGQDQRPLRAADVLFKL